MTNKCEQFSGPDKFSAFHRIDILIIEIKTYERDLFGTKFVGRKDRPVAIGKTAKVMDMGERSTLRSCDQRALEKGYPVL